MFRPLALGFALSISACAAPVANKAIDDSGADAFVVAHNQRRAAASPTPDPPLPPLVFDSGLAQIAQSWSSRCVFEHSQENLGENLAFSSDEALTPEAVTAIWADEEASYDFAANTCAPEQVCGHYTQIVWRATERVGCGVSRCSINGSSGLFWVCNYDPPGNFVGERPY